MLITAVTLVLGFRLRYNTRERKFTISYILDISPDSEPLQQSDLESFALNRYHPRLLEITIGPAISGDYWLQSLSCNIMEMSERYTKARVYGLAINVYSVEGLQATQRVVISDMKKLVWAVLKGSKVRVQSSCSDMTTDSGMTEKTNIPTVTDSGMTEKTELRVKRESKYISPCKPDKRTTAFITADIETVVSNNVHVPYAIGYRYAGVTSRKVRP